MFARREDFTIFYLIMFSLCSQTIILSILNIALKLDCEDTQSLELKINALFPLALSPRVGPPSWPFGRKFLKCCLVMPSRRSIVGGK
jgi:hypothetical protein